MQQNSLSANISYFNILGVRECDEYWVNPETNRNNIYNFMRLARLEQIVVFKLYVDTKKYTCHHPQVLNIGVKNAGVMLYLTPWQN